MVSRRDFSVFPRLQIPSTAKRILQTDADDEYWAAILLEEIDRQTGICGYRNGRFTQEEMHHHSTFKKILMIKYNIDKLKFHLIGHYFLVEMDMPSFCQSRS